MDWKIQPFNISAPPSRDKFSITANDQPKLTIDSDDMDGDQVTISGTVNATGFEGDGAALTVAGTPLATALDQKVETTGGAITGALRITGNLDVGDSLAIEHQRYRTFSGYKRCPENAATAFAELLDVQWRRVFLVRVTAVSSMGAYVGRHAIVAGQAKFMVGKPNKDDPNLAVSRIGDFEKAHYAADSLLLLNGLHASASGNDRCELKASIQQNGTNSEIPVDYFLEVIGNGVNDVTIRAL